MCDSEHVVRRARVIRRRHRTGASKIVVDMMVGLVVSPDGRAPPVSALAVLHLLEVVCVASRTLTGEGIPEGLEFPSLATMQQ